VRFILLAVIMVCAPVFLCAESIENEHLRVEVDTETGRLFLSRVQEGKDARQDDHNDLLFFDTSPSSYTVIYLDGLACIFGGSEGTLAVERAPGGKRISAVWDMGSLQVVQDTGFARRENSGREDGVKITYTVFNRTEGSHAIGMRILFDTYLGEAGENHFTVFPGGGIQYEKTLEGEKLPDYWISKGAEGSSGACLRGVLKGKMVTTPERITFANYVFLQQHLFPFPARKWNSFDMLPFSKNDSAVALYYTPVELPAGGQRVISTLLGKCGEGEYGEYKTDAEKPSSDEEPSSQSVEESVLIAEEKKEQLPLPAPEPDTNRIRAEMEEIAEMQTTVDSINSLIERIDELLLDGGEKSDEDDLLLLRRKLEDLKKPEAPE
jgi:hypothetical protein